MFRNPFSFKGRIRRTEYFFSVVIYGLVASFMGGFAFSMGLQILTVLYLPLLWFMIAQGTKRCHDLGTSGWFQIIPFYIFVMLFSGPASDADKYGVDPREEMKQIQDSEGGFFE